MLCRCPAGSDAGATATHDAVVPVSSLGARWQAGLAMVSLHNKITPKVRLNSIQGRVTRESTAAISSPPWHTRSPVCALLQGASGLVRERGRGVGCVGMHCVSQFPLLVYGDCVLAVLSVCVCAGARERAEGSARGAVSVSLPACAWNPLLLCAAAPDHAACCLPTPLHTTPSHSCSAQSPLPHAHRQKEARRSSAPHRPLEHPALLLALARRCLTLVVVVAGTHGHACA